MRDSLHCPGKHGFTHLTNRPSAKHTKLRKKDMFLHCDALCGVPPDRARCAAPTAAMFFSNQVVDDAVGSSFVTQPLRETVSSHQKDNMKHVDGMTTSGHTRDTAGGGTTRKIEDKTAAAKKKGNRFGASVDVVKKSQDA